jgi:hypothetical protein
MDFAKAVSREQEMAYLQADALAVMWAVEREFLKVETWAVP